MSVIGPSLTDLPNQHTADRRVSHRREEERIIIMSNTTSDLNCQCMYYIYSYNKVQQKMNLTAGRCARFI